MEQNAKQLLKRISDKIGALTDKEISRVSHAPQEKEWRAYIAQKAPHWEDIAWRVKEPNSKGEAEIHLGFYTANPSAALNNAIEKVEALSKGKVNHVVKNENGIRLVWKENLNDSTALDKLYLNLEGLLNDFLAIAFDVLITSNQTKECEDLPFIQELKTNGIEVLKTDITDKMTYEEAIAVLNKMGDGWRLPTIREASELFRGDNSLLGDYNNEAYLTSTFSNNGELWFYTHSESSDQEFLDNVDMCIGKVRPVRSNETFGIDYSYLNEIAGLLKQRIEEYNSDNVSNEYWEISGYNVEGQFTWFEAVEICKLLGDKWRLPCDADEIESISELVEMYGYYWTEETSEMYGKDDDSEATAADIDGGFAGASLFNKNNTGKIVLLRDLSE